MDVQPIATKEGDAILGEGATRVLDGVVMMLTGTDEGGVQIDTLTRTSCGDVLDARIREKSLSKVTS
jgi:hypothetical protein